MKRLWVVLIAVLICGCSAVTVRSDGQRESAQPPTFEKRYTYWWWGLKGEHSINVREVCVGNDVEQMQAIHSVTDVVSGLLTLGIYAPRTARIWCKEA